jgi:hypothetical protein
MTSFVVVQRGSWPGWANADIQLRDDAAAAYLSALAAYRRETGRTDGEIAEPVGGLRTPAIDAAMLAAFRSRDPAQMHYWNLDPASKAPPGLNSPHNNGLCADIWAGTASSWANGTNWWIVNGPRFGLRRTLVGSGDIHHFQYFPGTATAALDVTSLDGSTPGDDDVPSFDFQLFQATDNGGLSVNVGAGDWWCRATPSAPLERITNGQAADALTAAGLEAAPFAASNVHGKPGGWFIAAFAEDAVVHGYNVGAHPFLAAAPGTKLDAASTKALADQIAAANTADQQVLLAQLSSLIHTLPAEVAQELGKQLLGQN